MNYFLIAASFILVAFGQPAWISGFGVLAAAFGFALFWRAILNYQSPRERFIASVIWFSCVQGVQLSWMATLDYMGPLILVMYLFLIIAMGVQFGVLSFFLEHPPSLLRSFAMAGCWTLFEWMRLYFLCGFTWNPVGLSLTDSPYSLQFASVWGIFGLSFWVILVNLVALKALVEKSTRHIVVWSSLAFFPYAFGLVQQSVVESHVPVSGNLSVALVQTGLLPEQKDQIPNSHSAYVSPLDQWRRILEVLDPEEKVDLIVLPEAALPLGAHLAGYDLSKIDQCFKKSAFAPLKDPYALFSKGAWRVSNAFLCQTLANQSGAHVIVGLDDQDFTGKYNAAFHFVPGNGSYERYEKRVLVPVGEYVPLQKWRRFARFVAEQFGIYSSFDAGSEVKIFKAHYPIGISICLEETFSHLTRELRLKGAEVFVNLTNDVWFPRSKLPQQHFDHGRVRAAENGVPILRACNTGITGAVNCFGRQVARLDPSEKKADALYFSMPIRSFPTLYTWWGDSGILAISVGSLVSYFAYRKKKLP
ncbi:MAG: apolipoprotein N-acyltransferase [Chlamydiae bacterium CG10_big_fil_rev_8_21_14_0_10_42_34]|nr:MAG: apolipoprotein N-acyltransferase [Chlamydiae bacterium CG10_big_fil_rev_8_21_14_0_10_42_34]